MRHGFWIKGAIVVALIALFDGLVRLTIDGVGAGAFAGAWLAGLVLGRPDVRRNRRAWIAMAAAALFAVALVDDPGPLPWAMFWAAICLAALLPRVARFDDAWRWGARLALHVLAGLFRPLGDLGRLLAQWRRVRTSPRTAIAVLALPIIGSGIFLALFAAANPLIEQALGSFSAPPVWRIVLWLLVVACVWPSLRPAAAILQLAARLPDPEPRLPGTSLPSVLIALALFNVIFAVQNALDVIFLWNGGPLPAGMSQPEYVHRGAYPLIGTALIAGVMALAMLRPGSASAQHPWARRMVVLWVAQNLVLVASSALRTIDYIETSMLTAWRIAALAWMGLVALGLVLICWRILAGRSARWLINWNALAATITLAACTAIDLGATAAAWNVRALAPETIDLCYLRNVGDGAVLPLIALERRAIDPAMRDRVQFVRTRLLAHLENRQRTWSGWTPRGARRLAAAQAQLGPDYARRLPADGGSRACDGRPIQQRPGAGLVMMRIGTP